CVEATVRGRFQGNSRGISGDRRERGKPPGWLGSGAGRGTLRGNSLPPRFAVYSFLRSLLFLLPPEASHRAALVGLDWLHRLGLLQRLVKPVPEDPVSLFGLHFPNRVGLAAGLDKNADHIDALGALGFGFIEVGTVTPRPQPGNPKPRLFRLP